MRVVSRVARRDRGSAHARGPVPLRAAKEGLMTHPDDRDRGPGLGDPARSDDVATPGHRTPVAGSTSPGQVSGPSPDGRGHADEMDGSDR